MYRLRRVLLPAFALGLLFVIGCQRARPVEPIRIGVRTANDHVPFYIADDQGLYAQRGLTAEVRLVPSNTEIIEALQRGDFEVGAVPVTTAIAAISNGCPVRIVAMTGRGSDGLLVRRDDGLRALSDLRGKKIATIRASILDVLLRHALEQAGLDPEHDVDLVYMGKLGDMIAALKTGQVDASSNTEPFMTDAERQGWGQVLTYYTGQWPDHPCCVVLARDDFSRQSPDQLQAILGSHVEATDWANSHLDETAQLIVDYLGAFDRDLVRASLDRSRMFIDYHIEPGEIERMAELMVQQGLIERPIASEQMLNLDSLARALRERP